MKKINLKIVLIVIIVLLLVIIDQLIKYSIIKNLFNSTTQLINGLLNLTYVENTGGAFGIGSNNIMFFIIITVIIIGILIKLILQKKEEISTSFLISFSLIIAGGIGNLIDRIFRGYVVDYIDINPFIKYPVFNFADICIVVGIIILGISLIINRDRL